MNTLKIKTELAELIKEDIAGGEYKVVDSGQMKAQDPSKGTYFSYVFTYEGKCWQMDACKIEEGEQAGWYGWHNPTTGEWEQSPEEVLCAEVKKEERILVIWVPVDDSVQSASAA